MKQPSKNTSISPKLKKNTKKIVIKKKQNYGTSKLEKYFAETYLDKLNLPYIYEYEAKDIKRFYDFAIVATLPDKEILYEEKLGIKSVDDKQQYIRVQVLIEVDGDYYHSNPDKVDISKLSPMQKHNKMVDKIKDIWCQKHHIPLIRIWETDIRNNPKKVFNVLYEVAKICGKESRIYNTKTNPIKK